MSRCWTCGLALLLAILIVHSADAAKKKKSGNAPLPDNAPQAVDAAEPLDEPTNKAGGPPKKTDKPDGGPNKASDQKVIEPTSATYFGILTEGRRFVYVVDNSNSMTAGRFDTACYELMASVNGLSDQQQFYVIFFSDTAYPLFYPKSAKSWVPATQQNKDKLREWLPTVQLALHTRAKEAMTRALAVKPDAIFVLSDGAFTDGTLEFLLAQPKGRTKIHTLGMQVKEGAKQGMKRKVGSAEGLKQIADHFGGTYKNVEILAQFKDVSRQKNNKQNGVWGITLGQGKEGNGNKKKMAPKK